MSTFAEYPDLLVRLVHALNDQAPYDQDVKAFVPLLLVPKSIARLHPESWPHLRFTVALATDPTAVLVFRYTYV